MKKINLIVAILTLAIGVITASAFAGTTAGSGVIGSMHDITALAAGSGGAIVADNQSRVCVFCHTPHRASTDSSLDYNPLWNHKVTTQTYQPYESATFHTSLETTDTLTGSSRLCMSCHDGSIAVDSHSPGGDGEQVGGATLSGAKVVGSATSNTTDHPIGINYVQLAQAAPLKLKDPAATTWMGGTDKISASLEKGGIMTCSTCHDAHNKKNLTQIAAKDGITYNYLLRSKQVGSAICRSCHTM